MSIYASLPAPNCDYVFLGPDEEMESIGGHGPIEYRGSSVMPDPSLPREGYVDLACIPGDIRDPDADREVPEPYLRLGVNGATVVLDRAGVALMHRTLTEWLHAIDHGWGR